MTGCFGGKDMENEIGKTRINTPWPNAINVYLKCVQLWPALANSFNQFPTSFKKKKRVLSTMKSSMNWTSLENFMT